MVRSTALALNVNATEKSNVAVYPTDFCPTVWHPPFIFPLEVGRMQDLALVSANFMLCAVPCSGVVGRLATIIIRISTKVSVSIQ